MQRTTRLRTTEPVVGQGGMEIEGREGGPQRKISRGEGRAVLEAKGRENEEKREK